MITSQTIKKRGYNLNTRFADIIHEQGLCIKIRLKNKQKFKVSTKENMEKIQPMVPPLDFVRWD